jgi:[ribosomal protein S5]-alanine N-acetyltransferase
MALFNWNLEDAQARRLTTASLCLRRPELADFEDWSRLRERSREHLIPWEPRWAQDELSYTGYRRRLKLIHEAERAGTLRGFFLFLRETGELVGGLNLSNIRGGVSQAASIGYWLGLPFIGQGLMAEAVRRVARYSFETLELNRLEAACQPANTRSRAVLEKSGFVEEGFARSYLKINGEWCDHVLYGLLARDCQ